MTQAAAGPRGKWGLERRERQSLGTQEEDKAVLEKRIVD